MPKAFQNRVYEQADSYAKLAEEMKLEVKKTDWLTRAQVRAIAAAATNSVQTVFAPAKVSLPEKLRGNRSWQQQSDPPESSITNRPLLSAG